MPETSQLSSAQITQKPEEKIFSLSDLTKHVNNVNLNEEVVVIEGLRPSDVTSDFPVRVDALLIILFNRGHARISIDLKQYEIGPRSLLMIPPKSYITLKYLSDGIDTNVVACAHRVVEDIFPKLTDLLPLLIHHRTEPMTVLTEEEVERINAHFHFLKSMLAGPRTLFLQKKVICTLQAALFEMMDIEHSRAGGTMFKKSRKEEIMAKFILAVTENFREHRDVAYYANRLCITPKHLSAVTKEISGRTAGEWIENYVVMEAKVLLKSSDLTIQEIAARLNFTNQSFFGKYFKHQVGVSPTVFRNTNS